MLTQTYNKSRLHKNFRAKCAKFIAFVTIGIYLFDWRALTAPQDASFLWVKQVLGQVLHAPDDCDNGKLSAGVSVCETVCPAGSAA